MSIELPTLADAKAENLLRAAWQMGDMTPEWIAAFLRDTLPQRTPADATAVFDTIAHRLDAADRSNSEIEAFTFKDEAIRLALEATARYLVNRLAVVR